MNARPPMTRAHAPATPPTDEKNLSVGCAGLPSDKFSRASLSAAVALTRPEVGTVSAHKARKNFRCDHYWSAKCAGDGAIPKGALYVSPTDDCIDPFHPYRVCAECFAAARMAP